MTGGAKIWYFPDGYLPEKKSNGEMEAHEALMLFNTAEEDVKVELDIYFSDRPPVRAVKLTVPAERVQTSRLDHPDELNGAVIPPLTQYALRVRASHPIVAQFGRLDTTQPNMAYYTGVGFCE